MRIRYEMVQATGGRPAVSLGAGQEGQGPNINPQALVGQLGTYFQQLSSMTPESLSTFLNSDTGRGALSTVQGLLNQPEVQTYLNNPQNLQAILPQVQGLVSQVGMNPQLAQAAGQLLPAFQGLVQNAQASGINLGPLSSLLGAASSTGLSQLTAAQPQTPYTPPGTTFPLVTIGEIVQNQGGSTTVATGTRHTTPHPHPVHRHSNPPHSAQTGTATTPPTPLNITNDSSGMTFNSDGSGSQWVRREDGAIGIVGFDSQGNPTSAGIMADPTVNQVPTTPSPPTPTVQVAAQRPQAPSPRANPRTDAPEPEIAPRPGGRSEA